MMRRLLAALVSLVGLGVLGVALWLHLRHGWNAGAALLFAAAIPVGVDALLLAQQFAIGAWFRRREAPGTRHGPGATVRAWTGEIAASLRTFFYAQIRYGDARLPSADGGPRTPVLLVHGYVCNRGIWHPFARWLAHRGHPVDSVNLEPVFGSIDAYVPIVAEGVRRLRARTGGERVAIVAHSMGGVAVRAWLAHEQREPSAHDGVCAIVTLGTPHRGTWLAHFGHGRNVSQMKPDSEWLRALQAREAPATRERLTAIWSTHDNIVIPQAQAQQLPDVRTIAVRGRGHVALAYDHEVWQLAVDAIEAGCARDAAAAGP